MLLFQVWNLTNCKLKTNHYGHTGFRNCVTGSPDGSLCASGGKVRFLALKCLVEFFYNTSSTGKLTDSAAKWLTVYGTEFGSRWMVGLFHVFTTVSTVLCNVIFCRLKLDCLLCELAGWTSYVVGFKWGETFVHLGWRWYYQRSYVQSQPLLVVCCYWPVNQDLGKWLKIYIFGMWILTQGTLCNGHVKLSLII